MKALTESAAPAAAKPARTRRAHRGRKLPVLVAAVLLLAIAFGVLELLAAPGAGTAVHVQPDEIEVSTLAVGTHLIHLSALTEPLYLLAEQSAQSSNQTGIYYKSELADGAWFDITTATALEDITTSGTPVQSSAIGALWFTHHTKSDGITYDLLTGRPVNPFDINNPYDLRALEELLPLDIQHRLLEETQADSDQGQRKLARLNSFWATQVRNAATAEADASLGHLQNYYQYLAGDDDKTVEMEAVQKLMDQLDAARRYEVMAILEVELQRLAVDVSSFTDPPAVEPGEEDPGSPAPVDTALQTAVNESLANVTDSKAGHAGNMLSQGNTLIARLRYSTSTGLIQSAAASDWPACDTLLQKLLSLDNIMNDTVQNAEAEAALLLDELLPAAMDQFAGTLRQGENAAYAATAGQPDAVLGAVVAEGGNTLNGYRLELQYLIEAYLSRLATQQALDYVYGLQTEGRALYTVVPDDAFSSGARTSVDAYLDYLGTRLRELELAAGGTGLDAKQSALASLEQQRLAALDRNDLAAAEALQAQIDALQSEIDGDLAALAAQLNALNQQLAGLREQLATATGAARSSLEDELSMLQAQLDALAKSVPGGTAQNLLQQLKNECKATINNTGASAAELAALSDKLDTIIGMLEMDPVAVYTALQELLASLELGKEARATTVLDADIDKVERALAEGRDAYERALAGSLSTESLQAISDAFFAGQGAGPDGSALGDGAAGQNLTDQQKEAVTLVAIQLYVRQTGNTQLAAYLQERTRQDLLGQAAGPLLFQVPGGTTETETYVPARAVASLTGMRYVWSGGAGRVTLSKGGSYYVFRGYTNEVELGPDQGGSTTMAQPAVVQGGLFIPDSYTDAEFGVWAEYLDSPGDGARCGVAVTESLYETAQQLYTALIS